MIRSTSGAKYSWGGAETSGRKTNVLLDVAQEPPEGSALGGLTCTPGSSAVMYRPGKIMKFGGGGTPSRMTEVIDFTPFDPDTGGESEVEAPIWRRVGSTGVGRHFSSGVLLPDGNVIATGGTTASHMGDGASSDYAVFTSELFDPSTESWCRLADVPSEDSEDPDGPPIYRGYHSQSFLLQDGRVFLGAGGLRFGAETHFNHLYYFPPYLFKGERPEISLPSAFMTTGTSDFEVARENAVTISRVTMVKLASSTHNWDMEQRFWEASSIEVNSEAVEFDPPLSTCYATPGPYMLFAISDLGVPSIGQYVFVNGSCEAADEPVDGPVGLVRHALVNNAANDGLTASCAAVATLRLETFGRSVADLCAAFEFCPTSGTFGLTARLIDSDTQTVPSGGTVLDTATIVFTSGEASFTDDLVIDVSGTAYTSTLDLGPGRHTLELCATDGTAVWCAEQIVAIDAPLASTTSPNYQATAIRERFIPLARLPDTQLLDLDDNEVVRVDLPMGFAFPFFGATYQTIYVGANGGIRFGSGSIGSSNVAMGSSGSTHPEIAAYWDALDVESGGKVLSRHFGDRFIVSWERVSHQSGDSERTLSFQVHLVGDGRIELHYDDIDVGNVGLNAGISATIGAQNPSHSKALGLSYNSATLLGGGTRALAIAPSSNCVASAMRATEDSACHLSLQLGDLAEGEVCGPEQTATVPVPALPTLCPLSDEAFVSGVVTSPTGDFSVVSAGTRLEPGEYTVKWSLATPTDSAFGTSHPSITDEVEQTLLIQESRSPSMCCPPDLAVDELTSSGDIHTYGATAVCVLALQGNDYIICGSAPAVVLGHAGSDTVNGGSGADRLFGGTGDDAVNGGAGNDIIYGDDGDDVLAGDGDNDMIRGGPGADELLGGAGADVLVPGSGLDDVDGGDGNDDIVILDVCELESGEVLDGGDGTDRLLLPAGVSLGTLTGLGVTVQNVESTATLPEGLYGVSDCNSSLGPLAVSED